MLEYKNKIKSLEEKIKSLEKLVYVDALTDLLNRRGLDDALEKFEGLYERYDRDYVLCFLDIDFFKNINDTYGHSHGDKVLKDCAGFLKQSFRKSDIIGRFGGDEFLVIFPYISDIGKLRDKLEKIFDDYFRSKNISISFGLLNRASILENQSLLDEVDKLLLLNKHEC